MKKLISTLLTLVMLLSLSITAFASDLEIAVIDVNAPVSSVTLAPGMNRDIRINLKITGKQSNEATFKVYRDWTLTESGFVGSNPEQVTVPAREPKDKSTEITVSGRVIIPSKHTAGSYQFIVSVFDVVSSAQAALNTNSKATFNVTVTTPLDPQDTTAPVVTATADREANANGWYNSDVTVAFSAVDSESDIVSVDEPKVVSTEGANQVISGTAKNGAGLIGTGSININLDKTAPTISGAAITEPNANGWYNTDVIVEFDAEDELSGVASKTENQTISDDGKDQSVTGTAADKAGNNASHTVSGINIDKTKPVITAPDDGQVFVLNSTATPNWSANDATSGIATKIITGFDTNTVGTRSYKITAVDNAGNDVTVTRTYNVIYDFGGILEPISNNKIFKAGSTVPVKFQLTNANNAFVTDAAAKISYAKLINFVWSDDVEAVSTTAAITGNQFRYDTVSNQYIFNLSTKGLSSGTYRITITLDDGTTQTAQFGLK